jgi:hypothetical protein
MDEIQEGREETTTAMGLIFMNLKQGLLAILYAIKALPDSSKTYDIRYLVSKLLEFDRLKLN